MVFHPVSSEEWRSQKDLRWTRRGTRSKTGERCELAGEIHRGVIAADGMAAGIGGTAKQVWNATICSLAVPAGRRLGARVANTVVIPNKPTAGVTLSPVPRCPLASTETVRALFPHMSPGRGDASARQVLRR